MREAVHLTPSAVSEIKRLLAKEGRPGCGLRIAIEEGGCSDFSYRLSFDETREGDRVWEVEHVKIFVDPKSETYATGMTLDFADGLNNRGFKFFNPNAKHTCGCGESFSV